jgi:hypothetical protein
MIRIEKHNGIRVLRDDLLQGGTKSILLSTLDEPNITEYVYASPAYGGFQIALSMYCRSINKTATIFCATRKTKHPNTLKCIEYGANIVEVECGYLSVVEKRARDYIIGKVNVEKIVFGSKTEPNIDLLANRTKAVIEHLGREPDEIWVAVGSGTLISGILRAVSSNVKVFGVIVGADFTTETEYKNLTLIKYPKAFDKVSKIKIGFPSMPNYDLKAFELCLKYNTVIPDNKMILFWNVL